MGISFGIKDWAGWMPGAATTQEWQEWVDQGAPTRNDSDSSSPETNKPNVSAIPPMLRRRLSPMGRAAVSVMMPLYEQYGPMPIVYISRHGEVSRTLDMLQDIATEEPLSPTAFSLSVHNAVAGLFSIQQKATSAITAIAATADDLIPSLLEARGQINHTTPYVLCVFCDAPVPDFYHSQLTPSFLYSAAFVVSAEEEFSLQTHSSTSATSELPQALSFLRFLLSNQSTLPCNRGKITRGHQASC